MFDFPRWKVWAVTLVILAGILLAIPSLLPKDQVERWPAWLPSARINLGLDIAGGSQLLLEADLADAAKQRLQAKEEEVTTELRRGEPRIQIGDVSIACTAIENISSLADPANGTFNLATNVPAGTETAAASTDSHTVCDLAGNCATAGPISGNKIDKKAPASTITAPTTGPYLLNQSITVQFGCTDGGSGVASCSGTSANNGPLDTASVGAKTFTVNAVDNVGNTAAPSTVNYTVGFGVIALFDQTRAAKSGSTIPIKIRLVDANGTNLSSPAITVHAVSVWQTGSQSSPVVQDAGYSNPDFDFRYDAGLGGYIFNLQTTGYSTGSYLLNFNAGGSAPVYSVAFQVRQ